MNPSATLLIVDDIEANRETLNALLDAPDYDIAEAADGPTALRLAAEIRPDLILLDVMMPGMDGFEVCRRLRADPRLAEIPVILVTALNEQSSRLAGIEAGADDFITKPFNRIELRARVRTITRLSCSRRLYETQAALRASEKRFAALFALTPVATFICDVTGAIQDFNRRAAELWGREPVPGDPDERFCGPARLFLPDGTPVRPEHCPMAGVASGRLPEARDVEILIERTDGSRAAVIADIVPLTNEQGEITGAITCLHEVNAFKAAEFLAAKT